MNSDHDLERCLAFINCQLQASDNGRLAASARGQKWAVTISRQAGCRAHVMAEKLAEYLQVVAPKEDAPWTVLDRDLVENVLEEHSLPKRLAKFMPEDRTPEIEDALDDLLGVHPPSWILVRQTAETILRVAKLGNVILIGRGANITTRRLLHVLHVRLVGSLEERLERVERFEHLSRKAALDFIRRQDRGRKRYLKKYFGQNIDDPLLYHLIINTDIVSCEKAARIIADSVSVCNEVRPLHK